MEDGQTWGTDLMKAPGFVLVQFEMVRVKSVRR